jgi:predicted glycosyltransferase
MKVMVGVTHLLGAGHLSRALTLARAFAAQGHDTVLVSGGRPVPHFDRTGVDVAQLPPLHSDGTNFTHLLTDDGAAVTEAAMQARRNMLLETLTQVQPDILITELYPFGRRVLRQEFLALLQTARSLPRRPLVLASIRDILAPPSKPERATAADDVIGRYYDGVLVHSDERSTPLDQSWPVSDRLRPKLHYTGYVAPPAAGPHPDRAGQGEVIVAAGAGSVGDALFETAAMAARQPSAMTWRLLVGGAHPEPRIARLLDLSGGNAVVEPVRPDFRQLLYHADCAVTMCGYNTALDILQSGCPAVLVPFDDGGEVEQTLRAASLTRLDGITAVKTSDLSPETLIQAVRTTKNHRRPAGLALHFDGAQRSVEIAVTLQRGRG